MLENAITPNCIVTHKNGKHYKIVCIARSSNDCHQKLVVYQSLEPSDFPEGTIWVRTMTEFLTPDRFQVMVN